jgi:hypothetical protein
MPNSHSRRMAAIYVGSFSFKSGWQKNLLYNLYGHSPFIIGHRISYILFKFSLLDQI